MNEWDGMIVNISVLANIVRDEPKKHPLMSGE